MVRARTIERTPAGPHEASGGDAEDLPAPRDELTHKVRDAILEDELQRGRLVAAVDGRRRVLDIVHLEHVVRVPLISRQDRRAEECLELGAVRPIRRVVVPVGKRPVDSDAAARFTHDNLPQLGIVWVG
eukprot:5868848-Prymnesium_polylepis.2